MFHELSTAIMNFVLLNLEAEIFAKKNNIKFKTKCNRTHLFLDNIGVELSISKNHTGIIENSIEENNLRLLNKILGYIVMKQNTFPQSDYSILIKPLVSDISSGNQSHYKKISKLGAELQNNFIFHSITYSDIGTLNDTLIIKNGLKVIPRILGGFYYGLVCDRCGSDVEQNLNFCLETGTYGKCHNCGEIITGYNTSILKIIMAYNIAIGGKRNG